MKKLNWLVLLLWSPFVLGFEISGLVVNRGVRDGRPMDRLSPQVILEPGESVEIEYLAYREWTAKENPNWVSLLFIQPDGSISYPMGPRAQLTNTETERRSFTAALDQFHDSLSSEKNREWNVVIYGVRVFNQGLLPQSGKEFYSEAFSLSDNEIIRQIDQARLKISVSIPKPLAALVAIPLPETLPDSTITAETRARAEQDALAIDSGRDFSRVAGYFQNPPASVAKSETKVYFFTNRPGSPSYRKGKPWSQYFRFDAGRPDGYFATEAHVGWTQVSVPQGNRQKGKLAIAGGLPGSWGDTKFEITEKYQMWNNGNLEEFLDEIWAENVIVYIHGFNTDFEETILRAAQMREDLSWNGVILAVDWPSRGLTGAYNEDRKLVEGSDANRRTIAKLLAGLAYPADARNRTTARRGARHFIAHSMGNEVLHQTVQFLDGAKVLLPGMFQHMVFAAPDVFVGDFKKMTETLQSRRAAQTYTLYYSRKDIAVNISRYVNLVSLNTLMHPSRVLEFIKGRAGVTPENYPGVTIINTDSVNTSWGSIFGDFRHGYFSGSDKVLADISVLLNYGLPAEYRQGTLARTQKTFSNFSHYVLTE